MVKNDGHIDVVFRNGLKDIEVLPPYDLWDSISPALKTRRNGLSLLKVAAGLAAIISLSIIAFISGSRTSALPESFSGMDNSLLSSEMSEFSFIAEADQNFSQGEMSATVINTELSENGEGQSLSESSNLLPLKRPTAIGNESASGARVIKLPGEKEDPPESLKAAFISAGNLETFRIIESDESTAINSNRWKVGARISPTYLSSNLKAANQNMSEMASNENAVLSYTGGFALSYSMGNRLSLQTGVYYSSLGREISGISSYSGFGAIAGSKSGRVFGVETTTGTINTTNKDIFLSDIAGRRIQSIYTADNFDPVKANLIPFGTSLRQNFEYLEIPVILSYKIIDRRIDFNLLGGMSYNFLLDNKTYAIGDESMVLVGSTEDINSLLLSSALGMSLEYSLSSRFSFNIEPSLRYYLNNKGLLSVENSYTFGIYSGLFFKF